jgi:hypothetical protein
MSSSMQNVCAACAAHTHRIKFFSHFVVYELNPKRNNTRFLFRRDFGNVICFEKSPVYHPKFVLKFSLQHLTLICFKFQT